MGIVKSIEDVRGTVMSKDQFVSFISEIHRKSGNYILAAMYLNSTPATVRRVVKGRDSDVLRKTLGIKKSDRVRQCFECTHATKHNIRILREETGLDGEELLEDMVDVYFEYLEKHGYGRQGRKILLQRGE